MKSIVLSLFKGSVASILNQVLTDAMAKFTTELEQSKHLKAAEKSHVAAGADLLVSRIREEVTKQVNK